MSHDHLSIEWTTRRAGQRGERPPMLEEVCLADKDWWAAAGRIRIELKTATAVRYIPYTSVVEFIVEQAPITCPNEEKEQHHDV